MKIGVLSDTHDRLPTFQAAMDYFKAQNVSAVLHAGDYVAPFAAKLIAPDQLDVPLYCVLGNNDGEKAGLKKMLPGIVEGTLTFELAGLKFAMNHYIDWFEAGEIAAADVIISGHTHQLSSEIKDGKLLLNPGECCGWVTGRCTVALLDTDQEGGLPAVQIVDL